MAITKYSNKGRKLGLKGKKRTQVGGANNTFGFDDNIKNIYNTS